jgi:hypothetical protein
LPNTFLNEEFKPNGFNKVFGIQPSGFAIIPFPKMKLLGIVLNVFNEQLLYATSAK